MTLVYFQLYEWNYWQLLAAREKHVSWMGASGCWQSRAWKWQHRGIWWRTKNLHAIDLVTSRLPWLQVVCMEGTNLSAKTCQLLSKLTQTGTTTFKVKVMPSHCNQHISNQNVYFEGECFLVYSETKGCLQTSRHLPRKLRSATTIYPSGFLPQHPLCPDPVTSGQSVSEYTFVPNDQRLPGGADRSVGH